jgi:CRISPR type IV-associated protein Csf3
MIAYAVGDRGRVNQILRKHIKFLGKKRAYGKGRIVGVETEIVDYDYSMFKDNFAMRFLPKEDGSRQCRVRPPYWNIWDRVNCCEIGDKSLIV